MTKTANASKKNAEQSQIATVQVTAESIADCIAAGVGALGAAFYEPEQRVMGDNGKAYPHDASLPDGVADTGEIVDVNRFAFIQKQLVSVVCWKLETMLSQADERIGQQRSRILSMTRQLSTGRTTESQIERLADFLEVLIEQRAMLQVALDEACNAHIAAVGDEFETKALRQERERTMQKAPRTDLNDRLAKLGVTA